MAMEQLFYMAEVRNPAEPDYGAPVKLSTEEKELACQLVEQKTSEGFLPENDTDEQTARIQKRLEEKVKTGLTITTTLAAGKVTQVSDVMEALRASLKETPKKKDSKMKKAASAKSVR